MSLNVKKVLQQVRRETMRREALFDDGSDIGEYADGVFPYWVPATRRTALKDSYTLGELTAPSDRAFVEGAYVALLRRRPDADGMRTFLTRLRSGEMTKIEVLGALRWSAEGLARGVHVDGLLVPYTLHRFRRKRFIGPALRWAMGFAQIAEHAERTRRLEAIQAAETYELGGVVNAFAQQAHARFVLLEAAETSHSAEIQHRTEELAADLVDARRRLDEVEASNRQLGQLFSGLTREMQALSRRLAEREDDHAGSDLDALYVAFEEKFRGAPELIRERALPYVDIMRADGAGTVDAPILDLGCGRGDWLDILREHGMTARGVDSNAVFVQMCAERGLDVILGDVMQVLRATPDASLGGITGIHIVEHLPFDVLIELLDESLRVLRPGGVLALETPNPENICVGSHLFYLDPTHRNPLPPVTLQWMTAARGFEDARIERWTIGRDLGGPAFLPPELPGAASLNVLIGQTHNAADYAVIARRPR